MIDLAHTRIVLAHDWLVGLRGGERVLDRLARLFGPTRIYTLVAGGSPVTEAIGRCEVVCSPLQRLPGAAGRWRRAWLPLMPWAVGRLRVEPCDLLISTSSALIKGIAPPPGTPHLCYCHSPARYLWEQGADYALGAGGRVRRIGLSLASGPLRRWDRRTSGTVTAFLANSRHTAARIERCYGRTAAVVHPPVRTGVFRPDADVAREDWLLVVSALEPYKRVDLAIQAAAASGRRLRIAGDGTQRAALARLAGPGVELLGRVDDRRLLELYRKAAALVFPQCEDFGIVAAEAQAAGCPVVAFGRGGALDIVVPGTGVLFAEQTVDALAAAIERLREEGFDPGACRRSAERFSEERFDEQILEHARRALER
ncbi:MAG: glycosyltransferase [Planctomycetota bacterium]